MSGFCLVARSLGGVGRIGTPSESAKDVWFGSARDILVFTRDDAMVVSSHFTMHGTYRALFSDLGHP